MKNISKILKLKLDELLVKKNIAKDIYEAKKMIFTGLIKVNGEIIKINKNYYPINIKIDLQENINPYVSRGGLKLKQLINKFSLNIKNMIAIDIGASTGGFTDCLLQAGAIKVYAIDVGYGQLAWKLRQNKRVINLERINVRFLDHKKIKDNNINIITIDVSFISLKLVIPPILPLIKNGVHLICLIKPQFEAKKNEVKKGGIITNQFIHTRIIKEIKEFIESLSFKVKGIIESPLLGKKKGNKEFFIYAVKNK